jgi:hypothetical protein
MMTEGERERIKLLASMLGNLCVATIVAGILVPFVGYLYGSAIIETNGWWFMIAVVWLLVSAALYLWARSVIGRLDQ